MSDPSRHFWNGVGMVPLTAMSGQLASDFPRLWFLPAIVAGIGLAYLVVAFRGWVVGRR